MRIVAERLRDIQVPVRYLPKTASHLLGWPVRLHIKVEKYVTSPLNKRHHRPS